MNILKVAAAVLLLCHSIFSYGQTQSDATRRAKDRYQQAEEQLLILFDKILNVYEADTAFVGNLKASQALWVKFRTAELRAKYPTRAPGYYGSIHSMCMNDYLAELTTERITKLQIWIEGVEDGDACSGAIRSKE